MIKAAFFDSGLHNKYKGEREYENIVVVYDEMIRV